MEDQTVEQDDTTTCEHPGDAVMWNPWNKVVQCHRCGHIFLPAPVDPATGLYTQEAQQAIQQAISK